MMARGWYSCWIGVLSIFLMACTARSPLDLALERAGDNRLELEKVLQHYSGDSQKRKAAEFLISNMPYHFSREGFFVNRDGKRFRPDMRRITDKKAMEECIDSLHAAGYRVQERKRYDIHTIGSDFLIRQIELAFEAWDKPWAREVSFEDFCRYILPYRSQYEMLGDFREVLRDRYLPLLESSGVTNPYDACLIVNARLKEEIRYKDVGSPLYATIEETYQSGKGACEALCDYTLHAMRSVGIPVTIRQTVWTRMDRGHVWTAVLSNGSFYNFSPADTQADTYAEVLYGRRYLKPAKVYQRNFEAVMTPVLPGKDDGYVTFLKSPLIVDVSAEQPVPQYTLCIPVKEQSLLRKDGILYLCGYNQRQWRPVAMGCYDGAGKAVFEHVAGKNFLIVAECDGNGNLHYVSDPVRTDADGSILLLPGDTARRITHTFLKENIGKDYSLGYWDAQEMRFVNLDFEADTDSTQTYTNIPEHALLYYRSDEYAMNNRVGMIDDGVYKRTHEW